MIEDFVTDQWILREMRKQLHLTQKQLGQAALITQPFMSLFENGWRRPSPQETKRLVEALCEYCRRSI